MKNLADFKRRVKNTLDNGGTFTFIRTKSIQFFNHPFRDKYPDGKNETIETFIGQKFGRVQSNSFTRLLPDGRESWADWGKAAEWTFEENAATWELCNVYGNEYTETFTLKYIFE